MNNISVPSEELFVDLFSQVFGPEKAALLYPQYSFKDIYDGQRFTDFMILNGSKRVAIEIDGEAVHNKQIVSTNKFDDDQLKQNSMISYGWDVYRWSYYKLKNKAESVVDEMKVFLGNCPRLADVHDYLPRQQADIIEKTFELREHQDQALKSLAQMRIDKKTIALICHATGTGKTVTAVLDAKAVGGRTLFLAHTKDLVVQPSKTFAELWYGKSIGYYVDGKKEKDKDIVCGSVQSVALNLDDFLETEFDYIIIDEAHHASSESYQKIIAYFKPKFLLGLTATPERADNQNILEIFQDVAHRLDIKSAVECGQLAPVRCIRVKTNIDITNVRYNGVRYNAQELENKLYVPERNKLIVDTYMNSAKGKHTVIFCVSVRHANLMADELIGRGVNARAVSGGMSLSERNEILANYELGIIEVLCACDLLNEGWDSPKTDVLIMARPTMSKTLYTQQLGRGMRLAEGKDFLMVFDFVDNAGLYNAACSLHRMLGQRKYREGGLVLAKGKDKDIDDELYRQGEKPSAIVDFPISVLDYEVINVFDWQTEAQGMVSQMEFVRTVDVQSETIEKYIRDGKIKADLEVPTSSTRVYRYFKEDSIKSYAKEYGWQIITNDIKKDLFMKYIDEMTMSYSYKPVLIKAIFASISNKGRVQLSDLVDYFIGFYSTRKSNGFIVEKANSVYCKDNYTKRDVEHNILTNPYKRFEDMNMLRHTKTLGIIEIDSHIFRKLSDNDKAEILQICDSKLAGYYNKFKK